MPALAPVAGAPIASLWGSGGVPLPPAIYGGAGAIPRGYPHVTLWSDYPWNSGTPLRRLAALIDWEERHALEEYLVTHRFTARLPTRWEGTALLAEGLVLQVVRRPGEMRWYEITDLVDGLGTGGLTDVSAQSPTLALATLGQVPSTIAAGTGTEALQHILDHCPAGYTLGTVTPADVTIEPDVTQFAGASPGAAIHAVAAFIDRTTGQRYEASLTPTGADGRDGLALHLTQVGAEFDPITLPYGTALTGIRRTRTLSTRLTRAYDPAAGLADTGDATALSWWLVTDGGSGTIDLIALDGGLGLAIEDGQWGNDEYALRTPAGDLRIINDTEVISPTVTRCTVSSTTGLTVDSVVTLVTAAGDPVTDVRLPSLEAVGGRPILRPTASGAGMGSNLIYGGDFSKWNSLGPIGFTGTGLSTSRTTVPGSWLVGGAACQLQNDINRFLQKSLTIYAPVAGMSIHYWMRLKPVLQSHWGLLTYRDPAAGDDFVAVPVLSNGEFHELSQSYPCPMGEVDIGIKLANNGGGDSGERASYYVDAMQIAWGPTAPSFMVGSGPARAIAHANLQLLTHGPSQVSYDVTPLALHKSDPDGAGKYRELRLGAQAVIIGPGLGIRDTVRALEYVEPGRGLAVRLTLATRPALLSRALAGLL